MSLLNFANKQVMARPIATHLQEPLFLDIKIPLPSLAEQNKLVEGVQ